MKDTPNAGMGSLCSYPSSLWGFNSVLPSASDCAARCLCWWPPLATGDQCLRFARPSFLPCSLALASPSRPHRLSEGTRQEQSTLCPSSLCICTAPSSFWYLAVGCSKPEPKMWRLGVEFVLRTEPAKTRQCCVKCRPWQGLECPSKALFHTCPRGVEIKGTLFIWWSLKGIWNIDFCFQVKQECHFGFEHEPYLNFLIEQQNSSQCFILFPWGREGEQFGCSWLASEHWS